MNENRTRSGAKSFIWRVTGVLVLAIVTFAFTRSWVQTGLVTFLHHFIFLFVFYFHERIWLRISVKNLLAKSILKMLTYETLCGNVILGTITFLVTGNWKTMTLVTLTYIGIKHVLYIWNEFVWEKIKWRTKKGAI